jgi:hypothetical protein
MMILLKAERKYVGSSLKQTICQTQKEKAQQKRSVKKKEEAASLL